MKVVLFGFVFQLGVDYVDERYEMVLHDLPERVSAWTMTDWSGVVRKQEKGCGHF